MAIGAALNPVIVLNFWKKFISIDKAGKPVYKRGTYKDQDMIVSELGSERFPEGARKLKRETVTACEYRF